MLLILLLYFFLYSPWPYMFKYFFLIILFHGSLRAVRNKLLCSILQIYPDKEFIWVVFSNPISWDLYFSQIFIFLIVLHVSLVHDMKSSADRDCMSCLPSLLTLCSQLIWLKNSSRAAAEHFWGSVQHCLTLFQILM